MKPEVVQKVRDMFARILKIPPEEVLMDADLFQVYGLDSLRAVKLLSQLEVEYDILLPDHEVSRENLKSLHHVAATVSRVLNDTLAKEVE